MVFETLPGRNLNTSTFQISLQTFPEFAQSFVLDREIEVSEVGLAVSHAMIVQPEYFTTPLVDQWKYYVIEPNFGPHAFDVTTTIYRSTGGELVSDLIDVTTGFEKVFSTDSTVVMDKTIGYGQGWNGEPNVRIELGEAVLLEEGGYFLVMSFSWEDRNLFTLRLFGRQAGDNIRSGYDQQNRGDCVYTPADDLYPVGRAYTGLGTTKWDKTAEGSIGFGMTFRPAMAKVSDCVKPGQFNDIWNQGDIDLTLFGRTSD